MKLFLIIILPLLSACGHLFYQPDKILYSNPGEFELKFSNQYVVTSDNVRLHGWLIKNRDDLQRPKGLVLFYHGNAQNLSSHFLFLAWMTKHGYDVLIFDYRGYGISQEASPDHQSVQLDAAAMMDRAQELLSQTPYPKFIVYGMSIGGTVAINSLAQVPDQSKISLLVLDSTFLSYQSEAAFVLRSHWATYLLSPLAYLLTSDKHAPRHSIDKVAIPTLVIHGDKDKVVSYAFGEELFSRLRGKKWFWRNPDGEHGDIFFGHDQEYRKRFLQFIDEL